MCATYLSEECPPGECIQAALAEAEEEAAPAPERDFDEASEAGSAVSGMSAYTTASTTAGSTITSSGHSVSTIGGRKPQRKARQKVRQPVDIAVNKLCILINK